MDQLDSQLLDALQNDFPLCERPFKVIADRLRLSEDQVWYRVQDLIAKGVIRRLGASLDSRKLGYTSTLAAVSVKPEDVDRAAAVIGGFVEVTHCYLRKDAFNIWFTLIASGEDRIQQILERLKVTLRLDDAQVLNVPVERLFKLDARFTSSD